MMSVSRRGKGTLRNTKNTKSKAQLLELHPVPNPAPIDLAPHYDREALVRDWNEAVASEIVLPIVSMNDNDSELEKYQCAFGQDNNEEACALSFFIGEYDPDYYDDSANEEDIDSDKHYIPHALVFGRKHYQRNQQIPIMATQAMSSVIGNYDINTQ